MYPLLNEFPQFIDKGIFNYEWVQQGSLKETIEITVPPNAEICSFFINELKISLWISGPKIDKLVAVTYLSMLQFLTLSFLSNHHFSLLDPYLLQWYQSFGSINTLSSLLHYAYMHRQIDK